VLRCTNSNRGHILEEDDDHDDGRTGPRSNALEIKKTTTTFIPSLQRYLFRMAIMKKHDDLARVQPWPRFFSHGPQLRHTTLSLFLPRTHFSHFRVHQPFIVAPHLQCPLRSQDPPRPRPRTHESRLLVLAALISSRVSLVLASLSSKRSTK